MHIALATTAPLPEPDPDQELLLDALHQAGAQASMLSWRKPELDPAALDLVVLRSTWDSHLYPGAFRSWCERTGARTQMSNSARAVVWNLHKEYLRDLEAAGIAIVPTVWIEQGQRCAYEEITSELATQDLVVKPAISAGSFRTRRFTAAESGAAEAFLRELATDCDTMVQPYLHSTETTGERALIWIDGELTHAVRKSPRFAGEEESVSEALQPSAEERAFAEATLHAANQPDLLYARIDVMRGREDELLLSELELIEPSLFLSQHPPALARFVDSMLRRARTRR